MRGSAVASTSGWSFLELFVEPITEGASRLTVTETDAGEPAAPGPVGFSTPGSPPTGGAG